MTGHSTTFWEHSAFYFVIILAYIFCYFERLTHSKIKGYVFKRTEQSKYESIINFVTRLKSLAKTCTF